MNGKLFETEDDQQGGAVVSSYQRRPPLQFLRCDLTPVCCIRPATGCDTVSASSQRCETGSMLCSSLSLYFLVTTCLRLTRGQWSCVTVSVIRGYMTKGFASGLNESGSLLGLILPLRSIYRCPRVCHSFLSSEHTCSPSKLLRRDHGCALCSV